MVLDGKTSPTAFIQRCRELRFWSRNGAADKPT
jgi:hypothetical protein